jgi:hypothetical protein
MATVDYDPTLVGNALYLALFGLIFFIQALQLVRYRTWSFSCAMTSRLVLEIVDYLGRVQMHFNPFDPNPFLMCVPFPHFQIFHICGWNLRTLKFSNWC